MVRVWGGDLASYGLYSFDFVNSGRQHILAPDDVKVYTVATAFDPGSQVKSIEQSSETASPNRETYLVHEGTILRITQQNNPDLFLHIPTRIPNQATLVLHPAY